MSEEEIIDRVMMIDQWKVSGDIYTQNELNAIGELLDLYNKEKENNNSYEVTDLLLRFKFNSTDIYNKLEKNHKYKIEISGFRIPFLSSYPNINKVEE